MLFTAAGLAFSILAVQSCEFVELEIGLNSIVKTGLFQVTDPNDGSCVSIPDEIDIGSTDKAAQSCGSLAAIFGLIALVLILFEFCICKLCCARLLESCVYAVAYICQALTFLVYSSSATW
jgi:ABC-type cobalamin transport system permease subunit